MKRIFFLILSFFVLNVLEAQWLNTEHLDNLNNWSGRAGFFEWYEHSNNTPVLQGYGNGLQLVLGHDTRFGTQIVVPSFDQNIYFRRYLNNTWDNWLKVLHTGNFNKSDVDFTSRNITSHGIFQLINKDAPGAYWDNLNMYTDGENSYIIANGDEKGLHIKSNGSNRIILESNVGIGLSIPLATLDIERGTSTYGTACFRGTNRYTHFNYSTSEDTYIRGGKTTSNVIINDDYGNVLIGKTAQTNSTYKLDVTGKIRADEIIVNTTGADFVFESTYKLPTLSELEAFIKTHKHLPDIAPAKEMQENGVSAGEMQTKLLQKVEELTLYLIELKKENEQLKKRIENIEQKKCNAQ